MPTNVEGVELTQGGMHALFARMGHNAIQSGLIYNGNIEIDKAALDAQGFMPILTGVGKRASSGHWIMMIKGPNDQYYLFDPLGGNSGEHYKAALRARFPNLSVIPNGAGLNMGLCGYWVASAGLRARAALNQQPPVGLGQVGQQITTDMQQELANGGYAQISGWLRAVAEEFPAGAPIDDARELRLATEAAMNIVPPVAASTTISTPLPAGPSVSLPRWGGFSLYTDPAVKEAAHYVYDNYLGKQYSGNFESAPAHIGGKTVYRPWHGLGHTLRTMSYSELIVEEARKAKMRGEFVRTFKDGRSLADVTPDELKKIMIAQMFFVAGRNDERSDSVSYALYHQQSRDYFLKYVQDQGLVPGVFKDQSEVEHYAAVIEDKDHAWTDSAAHLLINQAHMVDLIRVKMPAESYLEQYFATLKNWIGPKAAQTVFATQRYLFQATGQDAPAFDSDSTDPYVTLRNGFYLMDKVTKKPILGVDGRLLEQPSSYRLKENESYMRIVDYFHLGSVATNLKLPYLPGSPELTGRCETDVDFCLASLGAAHAQAKIAPIRNAVQSNAQKTRRAPNLDELAAANIIREIIANPDTIKDDHVLLNGQRLDEKLFRDLLAKCDMAIVGTLLNDADILNVDTLMSTAGMTATFSTTYTPTTSHNIGEKWDSDYRFELQNRGEDNVETIKKALVHMMQDGSWYYTRLNAIAQGRDQGSSFKEVLFTALMVPSTFKALADTHPKAAKAPATLHKGLMNLPDAFLRQLVSKAESVIAHSTLGLLSDPTGRAYQQMKINQLSNLLAKTCSSTTGVLGVTEVFTSGKNNLRLDIEDPDGVLESKRVGVHDVAGSESEFSVYLPDDVALIPLEVTKGDSTTVLRVIAVRSPDFLPQHESGYAAVPFLRMQAAKLALIKPAIELAITAQEPVTAEEIVDVMEQLNQNDLPPDYMQFLGSRVLPVLQNCLDDLISGNVVKLLADLTTLPKDEEWTFGIDITTGAQFALFTLKEMIQRKLMLSGVVLPALTELEQAMKAEDMARVLAALKGLPEDGDISGLQNPLRGQIQQFSRNMRSLQQAERAPVIVDVAKVASRYDSLLKDITYEFASFEHQAPTYLKAYNQLLAYANDLETDLNFLRAEKVRMNTGSSTPPDFAQIEVLEARLQADRVKLADRFLNAITQNITVLRTEKPLTNERLNMMILEFNDRCAGVEVLRQERIKGHDGATLPIMVDLDLLQVHLQTINQSLLDFMVTRTSTAIKQVQEPKEFYEQIQSIEALVGTIVKLENTLDSSSESEALKQKVVLIHEQLAAKKNTYPLLMQTQLKIDELVVSLHRLCEFREPALREEITEGLKAWPDSNTSAEAIAARLALRNREFEFEIAKKDLFGSEKSSVDIISPGLLFYKKDDLKELFGINDKEAEKLSGLIYGIDNVFSNPAQSIQKLDEFIALAHERTLDVIKTASPSQHML